MKLKTKKKICVGIDVFVALLLVGANTTCGVLNELITGYLCGSKVDYSSDETQEALQVSDALCREITEEGIVLLQNKDDLLPLSKSELATVNVFGWGATDAGWVIGGSGSAAGNNGAIQRNATFFLSALESAGMEYNKEIIDMYTKFSTKGYGKSLNLSSSEFFTIREPDMSYYPSEMINNAKDFSDVALVVFSRQGGEGQDVPTVQYKSKDSKSLFNPVRDDSRTYLEITKEEDELLSMVTTNFDKVIVIVNCANAMKLDFLDRYENIDACLYMAGTGQSGTHAIPRVLRGKVTPSGKLTNTSPYDFALDPTYANYTGSNKSITYAENIYLGYKWFETADKENYFKDLSVTYDVLEENGKTHQETKKGYDAAVKFPFGFGLSYTEFEWEIESFTSTSEYITKDTEFTYEVIVTNVGNRKGKDVVELYVTPPYTKGGIEKSEVNLVDFAKTSLLRPGDSETLTLSFKPYDFASYDCYDMNKNGFKGYEVEKGEYVVTFRSDAHTIKEIPNSTLKYIANETIQFENDPVSGTKVENLFTGENAYAGCAIDGSDFDGEKPTYLTRADFVNTFPKVTAKNVSSGAKVSAASNYVAQVEEVTTMPKTGDGKAGKYLLYTHADGSAASEEELKMNKNIVVNKELVMELGKDYDNAKWDELLNQLSVSEMENMIQLGGYRTYHATSVGKKYMIDNDGSNGLNRSIQENNTSDPAHDIDRSGWTYFPSDTTRGCTWNSIIEYSFGLALAAEAKNTGVDGWYAPTCNMPRNPFAGRNSEYISEDPLFSGKSVAEVTKGCIANGVYPYVKHFAVNDSEAGRSEKYTWLTEQSLREIYLKPFEYAVKVGKATGIMTSFNRVGAVWAGGNYALTTQILRNEWGFRGATVTDYYAGSGYMKMKQGVYAGQDIFLTGMGTKGETFGGNSSNPTFISQARKACKNIMFSFCNTYYQSATHDSSNDIIKTNIDKISVVEAVFPWWIPLLVGIDLVVVGGLGVWTFFLMKKKQLVEEEIVEESREKKKFISKKKLREEIDNLLQTNQELELQIKLLQDKLTKYESKSSKSKGEK